MDKDFEKTDMKIRTPLYTGLIDRCVISKSFSLEIPHFYYFCRADKHNIAVLWKLII